MVNIMWEKFWKSYLTVVVSHRIVYSVGSFNDTLVGELLCNCCNVSSVIVASVFSVERLIQLNNFQKCQKMYLVN